MITEDYVSFEIAKLLKEKGFDEEVLGYYHIWDRKINPPAWDVGTYARSEAPHLYIKAPTLQMAMKWIRKVYNLCIEPYRTACGYLYTISTIPYGSCKYNPREGGDDEDSGQWTTYEKACEAAIKYCIKNLI